MHDPSRKSISDETLMRFVDGDLPPDERSVIAGEVARNPDLAQRLEAFRFTKEELAGAFAPALEAPPELIEKILRGAALASRISRWNLPSLAATTGPKRRNLRRDVMAIAAAVALLLAALSRARPRTIGENVALQTPVRDFAASALRKAGRRLPNLVGLTHLNQ